MDTFHTLQEYIVFTKGWEYILAISFIFAFIAYWRLVNGGHHGEEEQPVAAQVRAPLVAESTDPAGASGELDGSRAEGAGLLERELGG